MYQVVFEAYARQKSQPEKRASPVSGPYDMRLFGLCLTNPSPGIGHMSLFKNVTRVDDGYPFGNSCFISLSER